MLGIIKNNGNMNKSSDSKSYTHYCRSLSSKKIGDYLVEDQTCSELSIRQALELQSTLTREGVYKPIGKIMIEAHNLSAEDLERCLQRQRVDILSSVSLFKDLLSASVLKIANVAEHYVLPKNTTIFHEGDPGDTFCVIISGRLRVFRVPEDGVEVTLATLGPGEGVGEMALLTGEPRSATVETVEPTCLLIVPKNDFDQILAENPELNKVFLKILAGRLTIGNLQIARASETEQAYKRFLSEQNIRLEPDLIGKSRIIQKLRAKIEEVAADDRPVLIIGEPGTEKRDVAGLIHRKANRSDNPFLVIDTKAVSPVNFSSTHQQRDLLQLELAQDSALFGHERGILSFAKTKRLGLIEVGHGGTVVIENIDQLAESVQVKLAEFITSGLFHPLGSQTKFSSSVRIIVTTTTDLTQLVEAGKFNRKLYELLTPQPLTVPPLRERKRDLHLIVDHLIQRYSQMAGKSVKGINNEAYNEVMAYDWPGNMDELDVVVRRGVNLAHSDTLMPEELFIGLVPVEGKIAFNLLKLEKVRKLMQSRLFPVVPQMVIGLFFCLLLLLGLFGNQSPESNVSLVLVWGMWWPLLVLSWFLVARGWCSLCPMGALSNLLNRFCSLQLKPPRFLYKYGLYFGAVGLGIIIWAEAVFTMPLSPRATSFLLLAVAIFAAVSGLLYYRRTWCRFICPLGYLSGIFSRCSIVELRGNINVCNNECPSHGCYVGNKETAGCPMYEGPFSLYSNQYCILCGNCIKLCTSQAPRLNLRLPANELWTVLKPDSAMAVFVPLVIGTQLFRGLHATGFFNYILPGFDQRWTAMAMVLLGMAILSYLYTMIAGATAFSSIRDTSNSKANLLVYALLPLVLAFELGYHLKPLLVRAGLLIPVVGKQLGFEWGFLGASAGSGITKTLQILVILLGTLASKAILTRLAKKHEQEYTVRMTWRRHLPVFMLSAAYIYLFATF